MKYDDSIKKIVKERLRAMPVDITFSVGDFGEFTRDQLIKQVEDGTDVGEMMIEMEVEFIKKMPKISAQAIK